MASFSPHILILRLHRLEHIPSALACTELIKENGTQIELYEFGNSLHFRFFRKGLRAPCVFFNTLLHLTIRFLFSAKPSLIMSHGLQEQCLALWLNLFFGIPYVCHVHEIFESSELTFWNRTFFFFEGMALRKARATFFPDSNREDIYRKRYLLKQKGNILFNCPRLRNPPQRNIDLRKRYNLSPDSVLLTYVGGIGPANLLEETLCAVAPIPNVFLFILGWADEHFLFQLKDLIRNLHMLNRVIFIDGVNLKWEYLENSDIALSLYRPNTLRRKYVATASNKLMEGLAAGIPVIVSNEPDFKNIVEGLSVGICSELSIDSIQKVVQFLVNNPSERRRLGENGYRAHNDLFHYEMQLSKFWHGLNQVNAIQAIDARAYYSQTIRDLKPHFNP